MYVPIFNEEHNVSSMHSLIKSNPLGTWTTICDGQIEVNHIPFILDECNLEYGTLYGHVAKSNEVWKRFSTDQESIVVFQGEQAYISPSWYPSKHKHGKAVPTWNYTVVHAYGVPQIHDNADWLFKHLNELTDTHESSQALPWKVSDAPQEFIDKMQKAIVGIEIPITNLVGKWKLGQNRPEADQLGMVSGLTSTGRSEPLALAEHLKRHIYHTTGNNT